MDTDVIPISRLNLFSSTKIKARLSFKSPIHWVHESSRRQLLLTFEDSSGSIDIFLLDELIAIFHPNLGGSLFPVFSLTSKVGKVYEVSNFQITKGNPQLSRHEHELTLTSNSIIEPCLDAVTITMDKPMQGREDYSLNLQFPSPGSGSFIFEAQGAETRFILSQNQTVSRGTTNFVICLVLRKLDQEKGTAINFTNGPGSPAFPLSGGFKQDCIISETKKSYWFSLLDSGHFLFGVGNRPGSCTRMVVKTPEDFHKNLKFIGIANWTDPSFVIPLRIEPQPLIKWISVRLVHGHPKVTTRPQLIEVEPDFTILSSYNALATPHWTFDPSNNHQFQIHSEGEFCFYVIGPQETCLCRCLWDGVTRVVASTAKKGKNAYLVLDPDGGITLPLKQNGIPQARGAIRAAEALDVYTNLSEQGIRIRIEHFCPKRTTGDYLSIPPEVLKIQSLSALNMMIAARQLLRDSGWTFALKEENPQAEFSLMGFETNNPLHGDFPGHWHFATRQVRQQVTPHHYFNAHGVPGSFRHNRLVETHDIPNICLITCDEASRTTIFKGRNVEYRLVCSDGSPIHVTIFRDGVPWLRVCCSDDTLQGIMVFFIEDIQQKIRTIETFHYDPLLGNIRFQNLAQEKLNDL